MSWLYIPSVAFPESACSMKDCEPGSDIWASRCAPSATLSGKLTAPASWRRAWKKAHWMRLLSGPTLPPSTVEDGVARLILSLPDSLAKTCQSPVLGQVSTGSVADSFSTCSGLPMIATRGASFWRTSQASLLPPPPLWTKPKGLSTNARPPASWENWPIAAGMRNGSIYQRPTWVPATGAPDGFVSPGAWTTPTALERSGQGERNRALTLDVRMWPTPDAALHGGSNTSEGPAGSRPNISLATKQWLTPNVPNGGRSVSAELVASKGKTEDGEKRTVGLESQVKYWPSPSAHDGRRPGADIHSTQGMNLNREAVLWPTPNAHVIEHKSKPPIMNGTRKPSDPQISTADVAIHAFNWPTPSARDHKGTNSEEHATVTGGGRKHMDQLANFVAFSPLAQLMKDGQASSPDSHGIDQPSASKVNTTPRLLSQRLNPYFAEWLMGWPVGWTSATVRPVSSASETESWRSALQQHLSCLLAELDYSITLERKP